MKTFGFLKESGGPLHFLKESLRKVGGPLHFLKESLRKVGGPLHFLKDSLRNSVCFRIHLANWGGPPQIGGAPPSGPPHVVISYVSPDEGAPPPWVASLSFIENVGVMAGQGA